jgi:antitoxin component YwqK of YwqJK toxin-antitoxin module
MEIYDNFPGIPNEILQKLIFTCDPEDVLNFVCTCKVLAIIFSDVRRKYHDLYVQTIIGDNVKYKVYQGLLHGKYKTYKGGVMICKDKYRNGLKHGYSYNYNLSGDLQNKTLYQRHTIVEQLHYNKGVLISEYNYESGLKHGKCYVYDSNVIISEVNYERGEKHGISKKYYSNGNVRLISVYSHGIKQGYNRYNNDGEIIESEIISINCEI